MKFFVNMDYVKHLQKVLLMMIKDIDSLCKKHNIVYYLDGGSALGAVRHKGFIPWDDDLDITMDSANYKRFMSICRKELDPEKYCVQEGLVDWPCSLTKIRLRDTYFDEKVNKNEDPDMHGIFVDIFRMNNVPSNKFLQVWQYSFAKLFLSYQINESGPYESDSFFKKAILLSAKLLKIKRLRDFCIKQVEAYDNKETSYVGLFFASTRYNDAIMERSIYGSPKYIEFEDIRLPVPEKTDIYLTKKFGDYMTMPPIEQRVPSHSLSIDFGKY